MSVQTASEFSYETADGFRFRLRQLEPTRHDSFLSDLLGSHIPTFVASTIDGVEFARLSRLTIRDRSVADSDDPSAEFFIVRPWHINYAYGLVEPVTFSRETLLEIAAVLDPERSYALASEEQMELSELHASLVRVDKWMRELDAAARLLKYPFRSKRVRDYWQTVVDCAGKAQRLSGLSDDGFDLFCQLVESLQGSGRRDVAELRSCLETARAVIESDDE